MNIDEIYDKLINESKRETKRFLQIIKDKQQDNFETTIKEIIKNNNKIEKTIKQLALNYRQQQRIYQCKISINGLENEIWRIIEIPSNITTLDFNKIVLTTLKGKEFNDSNLLYQNKQVSINKDTLLSDLQLEKKSNLVINYNLSDCYKIDILIQDIILLNYYPEIIETNVLDGSGWGLLDNQHQLMMGYYNGNKQVDLPLKEIFNRKEVNNEIQSLFKEIK